MAITISVVQTIPQAHGVLRISHQWVEVANQALGLVTVHYQGLVVMIPAAESAKGSPP